MQDLGPHTACPHRSCKDSLQLSNTPFAVGAGPKRSNMAEAQTTLETNLKRTNHNSQQCSHEFHVDAGTCQSAASLTGCSVHSLRSLICQTVDQVAAGELEHSLERQRIQSCIRSDCGSCHFMAVTHNRTHSRLKFDMHEMASLALPLQEYIINMHQQLACTTA